MLMHYYHTHGAFPGAEVYITPNVNNAPGRYGVLASINGLPVVHGYTTPIRNPFYDGYVPVDQTRPSTTRRTTTGTSTTGTSTTMNLKRCIR